jgi:hypothetical protein
MNAHDRQEFCYSRFNALLMGILLCLIGPILIVSALRYVLGLENDLGSPPKWMPYFMLIMGLLGVFLGLWALPKGFDRRPVIVLDSEGLFYRPHGESLIPWQDIRIVKRRKHHIVLIRHSAPSVNINTSVLRGPRAGFFGNPIYTAIMEAWQSHGGAA